MNQTLNTFFVLLVVFLSACNTQTDALLEAPVLETEVQIIPLNLEEGYALHPITQDTIGPVFNSLGDTVITGKPIHTKGTVLSVKSDSITEKRYGPLTQNSLPTNRIPLKGTPLKVSFNPDTVLPVQQAHAGYFYLINSIGDTLKTGVPVLATPKKVKAKYTETTPSLPPRFKDNNRYNIQHMGAEQGLPSAYIHSIVKDSNDHMWMGMYGTGICKYDGTSYQLFTINEGLNSFYVRKLFLDSKGNLWIGSERGGLSMFDGQYFYHYSDLGGLNANSIYDIIEDAQGNIWCGSSTGGVSKFDGTHFTHYTTQEGMPSNRVWALMADRLGNVWIGDDFHGLTKYDGENFYYYGQEHGIEAGSVLGLFEDHKGHIWLSAMGHGVYEFDGSSFTQYTDTNGLPSVDVTSIYESDAHELWFTTWKNGITSFDRNSFFHYRPSLDLPSDKYWFVFPDQKGNLWCGSEGAGISIIKQPAFENFNLAHGLKGNTIWDMRTKGETWISLFGVGVAQLKGDTIEYMTPDNGLCSADILSIAIDGKGHKWFGSWGNGVQHYDGEQLTHYFVENGLSSDYVFNIFEDSKERIWFSTANGGVTCYNGSEFLRFSEAEGVGYQNVRQTIEDAKGNMWFATDAAGLCKYDGMSLLHYTEKEGLSSNMLRTIYEDERGKLWVGTIDAGISVFDGESFTAINVESGLSCNNIRSIMRTKEGSLFVGTEKGLNLIDFVGDQQEGVNVRITQLSGQDGLINQDFLLNCAMIDDQNTAWWGTGISLVRLDLNDYKRSTAPPKLALVGIDINDTYYDYSQPTTDFEFESAQGFSNLPQQLNLDYAHNHLRFSFVATDWSANHELRYSWMLENADQSWSKQSKETKVDYRNLAPGNYVFRVKAVGANHQWSEEKTIAFSITPPWWQSTWAYLLYILVAGLVIWKLYRYQLKRKLTIEEAKRIAEMDEMKTVFFSNISHEFRTPLTLIKGLSGSIKENYQEQATNKFTKNMEVLDRNSEQLLTLVNQLLELSKLESGMLKLTTAELATYTIVRNQLSAYDSAIDLKSVQLELNCTNKQLAIRADEKSFIRIIHNLVGNAMKFTAKGKITVTISAPSEEQVAIEIKDTGIGIAPKDLPHIFDRFYQADDKEARIYEGTGIGLALTKQLVDFQQATLTVTSEVGKGTAFTLLFPRAADWVADASTQTIEEQQAGNSADTETDATASNKPLILLVEDNADMRYFITSVLEANYQIITAENGVEGVARATERVPDFIISDWMMPKMAGPEFIQTIKGNPATSHIPCMLLTARADLDSKLKGYEQGTEAFLVKPFEADELKMQIKVLIDARNKLRAYYTSTTAEKTTTNTPLAEDAFIVKTNASINERIDDPELDGNWLAEQHFLSRSQFARKLKALTSKSVTEFIRLKRLELAAQYLLVGNETISEIAYKSGFNDPSYFTRIFTKEYGCSPSEWKAKQEASK